MIRPMVPYGEIAPFNILYVGCCKFFETLPIPLFTFEYAINRKCAHRTYGQHGTRQNDIMAAVKCAYISFTPCESARARFCIDSKWNTSNFKIQLIPMSAMKMQTLLQPQWLWYNRNTSQLMATRVQPKQNEFVLLHISSSFSSFRFATFRKQCILFMHDEKKTTPNKFSGKEVDCALTLLPTKIQNWFTIVILCFMHPFAMRLYAKSPIGPVRCTPYIAFAFNYLTVFFFLICVSFFPPLILFCIISLIVA